MSVAKMSQNSIWWITIKINEQREDEDNKTN